MLEQPLVSRVGGTVSGQMRLEAHERQSYDVHLTLQVPSVAQGQPPQQVCTARCAVRNLCLMLVATVKWQVRPQGPVLPPTHFGWVAHR